MLTYCPRTMGTGIPTIDAQHKELFKRLNQLFAQMSVGRATDGLDELLLFLKNYAEWHFEHEEDCMARAQCPVQAANKSAHAEFIRIFTALTERLQKDGPTPTMVIQVEKQFSGWMTSHVVKIDTNLKKCLEAKATA